MLSGDVMGLLDSMTPSSRANGSTKRSVFSNRSPQQLAIGYRYTSLYVAQEQESRRTNALLEIANTLNSHADFNEVSARALERAISLVGADYGALGVLDKSGKRISLASFKSAEGVKPKRVLKIVEDHGKSMNVDTFPAVGELIREGKTMR